MSSVNKVILIGRLGKDPEVRYTQENVAVANFTLATSEYFKDRNGERQERTEWHNIVAWRNLAEISEKFLKKGKQVYVEGRLTTRSWEDKEGNKKYTTEIVADNITLLGKREEDDDNSYRAAPGGYSAPRNEQPSGAARTAAAEEMHKNVQIDDDLPF
jgi:single-strand DNA-binding protein